MKKITFSSLNNVRERLLIITLGILLLTSILVVGVGSYFSYSANMHSIQTSTQNLAAIASKKFEVQLEAWKNEVWNLSTRTTLSSDVPVDQLLVTLDTIANQFDYIYFKRTDVNGNVIGYNENVADQDYFSEAKNLEGGYITDLIQSKELNQTIMIISAPIYKNEKFDGVLYGAFNILDLSTFVADVTVGEHGSAYVLDKNGYTIAHKDTNIVKALENAQELAKEDDSYKGLASMELAMIEGKTGYQEYQYGGNTEISAYTPIEGTNGWSVAVTAVKSEFFRNVYTGIFYSILVSILIIIVGFVILIRFANKLSKPIVEIEEEMIELGKGNFSNEFNSNSNINELKKLITTINLTKASLKDIIADTARGCKEMANGNFDIYPNVDYIGEWSEIEVAIKNILCSLSVTLNSINLSAEQVAIGSEQVSCGAQALSQGATEQASSIEELAATIIEISSKIKTNAENAEIAKDKVNQVSNEIMLSNSKMQEMIGAMTDISTSSSEISKIIKTIEDIAFQTNILALNAAVEASRAGEAGRGFAVVAEEVRNLASKSSEASKNTAILIENSIKAVEQGTVIAGATADSLVSVVEGAKEVTDTINEIAKASEEQAIAAEQVTIGVDQISAVVQTNSATAEQSAAASEELSSQSQLMRDTVGRFTLNKMVLGQKITNVNSSDYIDSDSMNIDDSKY